VRSGPLRSRVDVHSHANAPNHAHTTVATAHRRSHARWCRAMRIFRIEEFKMKMSAVSISCVDDRRQAEAVARLSELAHRGDVLVVGAQNTDYGVSGHGFPLTMDLTRWSQAVKPYKYFGINGNERLWCDAVDRTAAVPNDQCFNFDNKAFQNTFSTVVGTKRFNFVFFDDKTLYYVIVQNDTRQWDWILSDAVTSHDCIFACLGPSEPLTNVYGRPPLRTFIDKYCNTSTNKFHVVAESAVLFPLSFHTSRYHEKDREFDNFFPGFVNGVDEGVLRHVLFFTKGNALTLQLARLLTEPQLCTPHVTDVLNAAFKNNPAIHSTRLRV
jgi:hypothetical protein